MSKRYVRCRSNYGQSYLTMGKEYELMAGVCEGRRTVINDANYRFSYDSELFTASYRHSHGDIVPHKHARVIHAWAEGHPIQCRSKGFSNAWILAPYPTFSDDIDYRIHIDVDDAAIAKCKEELEYLAGKAASFKDHYDNIRKTITAKNITLLNLEHGEQPDD